MVEVVDTEKLLGAEQCMVPLDMKGMLGEVPIKWVCLIKN